MSEKNIFKLSTIDVLMV